MICPDLPDGQDFLLKGGSGDMVSKSFGFYIERCKNVIGSKSMCKTDTEINEFIKDIDITGWNIHEEIDFSIYGKKPTFKVMTIWGQWLLRSDVFIDEFQQLT